MNKKVVENLLIASFVILSIGLSSIIWKYIDVNFSNLTQAKGAITQQNHSTDTDTLRYIIFILFPLLTFILSYYFLKIQRQKI